MATLVLGEFADFSSLYASYPSNTGSGDLFDLPAYTRAYCHAEQAWCQRSSNGKHWDYPGSSRYGRNVSGVAKYPGPVGLAAVTTSVGVSSGITRGLVNALPGGKAGTITHIAFSSGGTGSAATGSDQFDIRAYICGPDGNPLAGVAPLKQWHYAAGGAGVSNFSLVGIGAGTLSHELELHDGSGNAQTWDSPPIIALMFANGLTGGTLPTFYVPALTGTVADGSYRSVSSGTTLTDATADRTTGYAWAQTYAAGDVTPWGNISVDQNTNLGVAFYTRLTA